MTITIGTTPTIIFRGFKTVKPSEIVNAILTLTQRTGVTAKQSQICIRRTLDTATVGNDSIAFTLTQEETLQLVPSSGGASRVTVTLNFLTASGLRGTSVPAEFDVKDNPIDEVMT